MNMQRRHFELIAAVIREEGPDYAERQRYADAFVLALAGTNPAFNAARFRLAACGPEPEPEPWRRPRAQRRAPPPTF
jgi:hypothetical protein